MPVYSAEAKKFEQWISLELDNRTPRDLVSDLREAGVIVDPITQEVILRTDWAPISYDLTLAKIGTNQFACWQRTLSTAREKAVSRGFMPLLIQAAPYLALRLKHEDTLGFGALDLVILHEEIQREGEKELFFYLKRDAEGEVSLSLKPVTDEPFPKGVQFVALKI